MYRRALACVALLAASVTAQLCAESNNNNQGNCNLGALPQDGTTVYYAPDDTGNIEFFGQSDGQCDANSQATVTFYTGYDPGTGTQLANCGCLPLDGNKYVLDCGIPKGPIPEGSYHFMVEENSFTVAYVRFNIVHQQVTSTATTSTNTVTTTTYESTTVTTTSTETNTVTAPPSTVTLPAGTADVTATITPSEVRTTTTKTDRTTKYKTHWTETVKTRTITAPCQQPSRCPFVPTASVHRLVQRQQNGYTVTGDGPLTTTVTPSPVMTTETDDGGTTTDTATAYTTTTTTVSPTPPTNTIYSGTATVSTTITLPTTTSTITRHTCTSTTVTVTDTLTCYRTTHVTPTCVATRL